MTDAPKPRIAPLSIRQRIARPQPRGLPLINMGFNELPYPPAPHVRKAIDAAAGRANAYGDPTCRALRAALADTHGLDPEDIVCGNGSEELLDVVGRVFAGSGDEILISEFGYIQFPIVANRVGARLVKAAETGFRADIDALLAAVTERTRILYLANPNNPTGTMNTVDELSRLIASLPKHVLLTLDLAYGEFAGADYCPSVHALARDHGNVIVTRTFSKAFGLAGLRAGWCHAPSALVPALYAGRGMGTVNAVAQAAALAALERPDHVAAQVQTIVDERERVAAACRALGLTVVASHTNFLLAGLPGDDGRQADAMAEHLFDDAGIVVNRTREDRLRHFIRFSMSLPEHNDLLLRSLGTFLSASSG